MTPEEFFVDVAAVHPRAFWLDGGGSRDWSGRRSLVGWLDEDDVSLSYDATRREVLRHRGAETTRVGDDIFTALAGELAAGDASDSWVGYLGYACRPDLPARPAPPEVPDAVWMRASHVRVFEHDVAAATVHSTAPAASPVPVPAAYAAGFAEVQRQLHLGNSYEVNLTYRGERALRLDPVEAYLDLRALNPAPYAGYLQHHGVHLLSSSPERFATVDRHGWVETKPMKGTTLRGATEAEDAARRAELAEDPRFRAENLMIVDLLRNDLSMVCEPGTVGVPSLMEVESYATVHQLVSTVRGRLRDGIDTVAALRALFPAGSMTGAPKLRTMEIIDAVETSPRGVYAGAFGWLSGDGRADLGVVIRSLVTTVGDEGQRWWWGTGGGITVRSDVAEEYAESRWKAERLLRALDPTPR